MKIEIETCSNETSKCLESFSKATNMKSEYNEYSDTLTLEGDFKIEITEKTVYICEKKCSANYLYLHLKDNVISIK